MMKAITENIDNKIQEYLDCIKEELDISTSYFYDEDAILDLIEDVSEEYDIYKDKLFFASFTCSYAAKDNLNKFCYRSLVKIDIDKAKDYFVKSILFSYLKDFFTENITCWANSNDRKEHKKISNDLFCNRVFYLSQNIISGWLQEASDVNTYILKSLGDLNIEDKDTIEFEEYTLAPISWFIVELYNKFQKKNHSALNYINIEIFDTYTKVLSKWREKNVDEVDRLSFLLCERHLIEVDSRKIDIEERISSASTDKEIFDVASYNMWQESSKLKGVSRDLNIATFLFPYEILTWLKLREKSGLENPTEFSHPLMNTPIARFFLELETPLAKPKELPYVKELLIKLKEKCPDIEIPEYSV